MTGPGGGRSVPEPLGRRLALTPIGLDVVAALVHDPRGMRLTPLAVAIGSPVSSVQAALRILLANGLVVRDRQTPPLYDLAPHPARDALIELSLLLPAPSHVLGVVLRASGAVAVAVVDRDGFAAGLETAPDEVPRHRLERSLETIARAHPDAPPVQVADLEEWQRLASVSVGTRARLQSAVVLKGAIHRMTKSDRRRSSARVVETTAG